MANQIRFQWQRLSIILILVIILASTAVMLWLNQGRRLYAAADLAFQQGECQAAQPYFAKLKRYPSWAGDFVSQAAAAADECLAFEQALRVAETAEFGDRIAAYESFLAGHADGPLAPLAMERKGQALLAWGDDLQASGEYDLAVATHERLAAAHPALAQENRDQLLAIIVAWGESLRRAGDFPGAITIHEDLAAAYPEFRAEIDEQLAATYLLWGESLQASGEFGEAIAVYDQLAAAYPALGQQVNELLLEAYLAWGNSLHLENAFPDAVAVYNELGARDSMPAAVVENSRNQTYLDWGKQLLEEGEYETAAQLFQLLLALEHERMAPLSLTVSAQTLPWPYPYGLARIEALSEVARLGPGLGYESLADSAITSSAGLYALIGASPDAGWYAITATGQLGHNFRRNDPELRDLGWESKMTPTTIAWVPAEDVELVLVGNYDVPLFGLFVHDLAAESEVAARAFVWLQATYAAWAESATVTGDYIQATSAYVALAEWATDDASRENYWRQIAHLHLQAAEALAADGAYETSLTHAFAAVDYDPYGDLRIPASTLLTANLLILGEEAAGDQEWELAVTHYSRILRHERDTFTTGLATIIQDQTPLYAAADTNSELLTSVAAGRLFPIIAQQSNGDQEWALLLVPSTPEAQAWVATEQLTATVPVTTIINNDDVTLPPLGSYAATFGLAQTHQQWGQALHTEGDYEAALAHYLLVLNDANLATVITGTAELAARAWIDWGSALLEQGFTTGAVEKYANALRVAPDSQTAVEAGALLAAILDEVAIAVTDGGGCSQVNILDHLHEAGLEQQARQILPQALYQCGQEQIDTLLFDLARASFQRIIDDFSAGNYLARANRGLLLVNWFRSANLGIEAAARSACNEAGASVQASFSTLQEPLVIYVHGRPWTGELPNEWKGSGWRTTVVVCVDDVEEQLIERCGYGQFSFLPPTHFVYRYRSYSDVRIVDPITRLTVAQGRLEGGIPERCKPNETFGGPFGATTFSKTYKGSEPRASDLTNWLERFIPR
jgi:tetratricopeptide (TPR) repeat protein